MPEHVRHTNTPRFTDAHVGGDRPSQSAHCRLSGCLSSSPSFFFCALICVRPARVRLSVARVRAVPVGRAEAARGLQAIIDRLLYTCLSPSPKHPCAWLRGDDACDGGHSSPTYTQRPCRRAAATEAISPLCGSPPGHTGGAAEVRTCAGVSESLPPRSPTLAAIVAVAYSGVARTRESTLHWWRASLSLLEPRAGSRCPIS